MSERPPKRVIGWDGTCPHCGEPIRFRLETDYGTFGKTEPESDWLASLSVKERELLDIAEKTGILQAYTQVMRERKAVGSPLSRNPSKSFLRFLTSMVPYKMPPEVELVVQSEFPNRQIGVYHCGDIAAITIQGELRLFIPTKHLVKKKLLPVPNENGTVKIQHLKQDMADFRAWVKTKMGYVPAEGGAFVQEMRKRCYGAFGLPDKPRAKEVGK